MYIMCYFRCILSVILANVAVIKLKGLYSVFARTYTEQTI